MIWEGYNLVLGALRLKPPEKVTVALVIYASA